jgi:hypothetical protein
LTSFEEKLIQRNKTLSMHFKNFLIFLKKIEVKKFYKQNNCVLEYYENEFYSNQTFQSFFWNFKTSIRQKELKQKHETTRFRKNWQNWKNKEIFLASLFKIVYLNDFCRDSQNKLNINLTIKHQSDENS